MRYLTHDEETLLFDALNNIPALGWSERLTIYRAAQEIPGAWTTAKHIDLGAVPSTGQIVTLHTIDRSPNAEGIIAALQRAAALTGSDLDRHAQPKNTTETENNA